MDDLGLVGNLAVVAGAAVLGGVIARLARLPVVLGYLAAGIAIGPNTPGFVGDVAQVETVADLGVALLMFTLGIRFSFKQLRQVGGVAVGGGLLQVAGMVGVGFLIAPLLGLDTRTGFLLGAVVAMSSTVLALRLLEGRAEIDQPGGRVAISISLVQDLSAVPLIVMIPALAGDTEDLPSALSLAVAKALLLLAGVWVLGVFIVPQVIGRLAVSRTRELFLMSVVALALGTASVSFLAGLSLAFGAFLAGIIISESEYAHRTLAEVFPLREVFAVVFFVGIGMLIDPAAFVDNPDIVLVVAAVGMIAKFVLITAIVIGFGYSGKTAVTAGLALGSMAEFSFVLVREGAREGLVTPEVNEAILAAVLLSIAVTPLALLAHRPILRAATAVPLLAPLFQRTEVMLGQEPERLANHVVICGFYEAGEEIARAVSARGFRYLVIDDDPVVIRRLAAEGVPCILGDATMPTVLEQAQLERARVLAVTFHDVGRAELAVSSARHINPRLDVIARGTDAESTTRLHQAGASQVVREDFELGLEFVRHTLHRFGVSAPEIQAFLSRRRRDTMGG
jgi:monovalent cation:H+ antiporter-2, CPA2 family